MPPVTPIWDTSSTTAPVRPVSATASIPRLSNSTPNRTSPLPFPGSHGTARVFLLAVLCLLAPAPASAQLADSVRQRVDQIFAGYDRTDAPGCAVGLYRNGVIVHARGYGMANLELGVAIRPSTVFDIGSTSKQFTAFSIALLEQDGRLSQDDPVRRYLPELGDYANGITIRQIVHHTSGIRDYLTLMSLAGVRFDDVTTDQDALDLITRQQAANFPPNTEFLYSNSGYFLLSTIVERVSGKNLRSFAQERIFDALGMRHTHYHNDHTMIVPERATGYSPQGTGYGIDMSGFEQTGDGGVFTTVEDLILWDQNFSHGRVGGLELVAAQQAPAVLESGRTLDYAGGLVVAPYRGLPAVRHGGSWAGYRAELLRFPQERFSVAVLCNRGDADPSQLADRVADVVLADRLGPSDSRQPAGAAAAAPAVHLGPEALAARAGVWVSPTTGEVRRISLVDDHLVMGIGTKTPLVPLAANRFRTPNGTILAFESAPSGTVLRMTRNGQPLDSFEHRPESRLTNAELKRFAGTFHAAELGVSYRVEVAGDTLFFKIRDRTLATLFATFPGGFSSGSLHVTFPATARPTAFELQAGRVRGIRFVRVP